MALIVEQQQQDEPQQQQQHKHYCRICKKGFGCGRALGGHMRAHGISDESCEIDEEEEDHISYEWSPKATKAMYSLRTNPNRLKSCRVCENCGKEFSSWKSFLEHGKCTSDETDSDMEESNHGSDVEEGSVLKRSYGHNWSKRKRSFRAKVGSIINPNCPSTTEEEDLAHCLMMLSNGIVEPFFAHELEESCASASKDEEKSRHFYNSYSYKNQIQSEKTKLVIPKGLFECKACKKVFNSHQALGGHRASHKKVKGCFAAKLDTHQNNEESMVTGHEELYQTKLQYDHINGSKKKSKVHECSICYRVFSSGQALGGHKRCHWITSKNSPDHGSPSVAVNMDSGTLDLTLDLNFHALDDKIEKKQISQEIYLLPWEESEKMEKTTMEDERETKFAKLIELKEMNTSESSSQWLQVGLVSTTSQPGSDPN